MASIDVNVVDRLPADERWTHYYKARKHYTRLDYLAALPHHEEFAAQLITLTLAVHQALR